MGKRNKSEDREIEALNKWINYDDTTREIYYKYERDFPFFLMFFRNRVIEDGIDKYRNMTDADIERACQAVKEEQEKKKNDTEDGKRTISIWNEDNERDIILMIQAFAELPADDRSIILSIRTFLDR